MLYPNGQQVFATSTRFAAGALAATGAAGYGGIRGARLNRFVSETFSQVVGGLPSGYGGRSALLPVKGGGVSSVTSFAFAGVAEGVLGLPGEGSASITFAVADALGQLIVSGSGSAAMAFSIAPTLLTAALGGSGSASFSVSTSTPTLGALAGLTGTATLSFSGTLTPYAIGHMEGSTADVSGLTPAAVAAAVWSVTPPEAATSGSIGEHLVKRLLTTAKFLGLK